MRAAFSTSKSITLASAIACLRSLPRSDPVQLKPDWIQDLAQLIDEHGECALADGSVDCELEAVVVEGFHAASEASNSRMIQPITSACCGTTLLPSARIRARRPRPAKPPES